MKWIKLSDRMPDKKIDGSKVLIFRVPVDDLDKNLIDILDTSKTKYCHKNETYWMNLPETPNITNHKKTDNEELCFYDSDMSVRLWNALQWYWKTKVSDSDNFGDLPISSIKKIDVRELRRVKGIGQRTLLEFIEFCLKYM